MLGFRWTVGRPAYESCQIHLGVEKILCIMKEKAYIEGEYTIFVTFTDTPMFDMTKAESNLREESL